LKVAQPAAQINRICDRLVRLCGAKGAAHSGGDARVVDVEAESLTVTASQGGTASCFRMRLAPSRRNTAF
jgi:hypothetical protein